MDKLVVSEYEFIEAKPPVILKMNDFWLCADLHFGHRNIIAYEPPRLTIANNIDDMNEYLVNAWNKCVAVEDTAVILGDISLGSSEKTIELVNRLNGVKFLVMGNHDKGRSINYWRRLFVDAFTTPIKIGSIIYSHEPVTPQYLIDHQAQLNVHGHTHTKFLDDPRYVCVSVEQIGFKPVKMIDGSLLIEPKFLDIIKR